MAAPTIAVSVQFGDHGEYAAVAFSRPLIAVGAVPLLLPYVEEPDTGPALLDRADGLLLTGGRDIEPARYRDHAHPAHPALGPTSRHRDASEIPLAAEALDRGLPVLGICRGMQVLNVVRGGSLHQDGSEYPAQASAHPRGDLERYEAVCRARLGDGDLPAHPSHPIRTRPGSLLAGILGDQVEVNSYHHQALDALGAGVEAVAWSDDGIIEAIEVGDAPAFALGVQWELQESWQDDERFLNVFRSFVDAAAGRGGSHG